MGEVLQGGFLSNIRGKRRRNRAIPGTKDYWDAWRIYFCWEQGWKGEQFYCHTSIKGKIVDLTPTYIIVNNNDIGYFINISLNSYSKINGEKEKGNDEVLIFIHQVIREDANILFGFINKSEREIFRHLISVSGVGANTARMILSSLSPVEIQNAILNSNVNVLKSVKGIGAKSAQRIIIDLKDKLGKESDIDEIFAGTDNTIKEESLSALVMLGFSKKLVDKEVTKILSKDKNLNVEEVVKTALKRL